MGPVKSAAALPVFYRFLLTDTLAQQPHRGPLRHALAQTNPAPMKAPRLSQRGRQQRPLLVPRLLVAFVLTGCALLALSLYMLHSSLYSQQQREASAASHGSSSTPTTQELYGTSLLPGNSSRVGGPNQLLVRRTCNNRPGRKADSSSSPMQAVAHCHAPCCSAPISAGAWLLQQRRQPAVAAADADGRVCWARRAAAHRCVEGAGGDGGSSQLCGRGEQHTAA